MGNDGKHPKVGRDSMERQEWTQGEIQYSKSLSSTSPGRNDEHLTALNGSEWIKTSIRIRFYRQQGTAGRKTVEMIGSDVVDNRPIFR